MRPPDVGPDWAPIVAALVVAILWMVTETGIPTSLLRALSGHSG